MRSTIFEYRTTIYTPEHGQRYTHRTEPESSTQGLMTHRLFARLLLAAGIGLLQCIFFFSFVQISTRYPSPWPNSFPLGTLIFYAGVSALYHHEQPHPLRLLSRRHLVPTPPVIRGSRGNCILSISYFQRAWDQASLFCFHPLSPCQIGGCFTALNPHIISQLERGGLGTHQAALVARS